MYTCMQNNNGCLIQNKRKEVNFVYCSNFSNTYTYANVQVLLVDVHCLRNLIAPKARTEDTKVAFYLK